MRSGTVLFLLLGLIFFGSFFFLAVSRYPAYISKIIMENVLPLFNRKDDTEEELIAD